MTNDNCSPTPRRFESGARPFPDETLLRFRDRAQYVKQELPASVVVSIAWLSTTRKVTPFLFPTIRDGSRKSGQAQVGPQLVERRGALLKKWGPAEAGPPSYIYLGWISRSSGTHHRVQCCRNRSE